MPCTPCRSAAAALQTRPRARAVEPEPATPKTQKRTTASQRLCLQGGRGCAVHRQKIEPRWSWPVVPQCVVRTHQARVLCVGHLRELPSAPQARPNVGSWWVQRLRRGLTAALAVRVTRMCGVRARRVVARG